VNATTEELEGVKCVCCGRAITVSQKLNESGFRRLYSLREKLFRKKDKPIQTWVIHDDQAASLLGRGNGFQQGRRVKRGVWGWGNVQAQTTFGVLNGKIYLDDLPHDEHGCQLLTPSQINQVVAIRRARRKPVEQRTRRKVLEIWKHRCARCGARRELEIHHKRAVVPGGGNQLSNLVVLCRKCHFKDAQHFSEHIWPDLEAAFLKSENPTLT